jgi:membrane protein CcdC involved in cytochrome C biogenesis
VVWLERAKIEKEPLSIKKILPPLLLAGGRYLGISQRLSYTFKEFLRGWPIAFGHFTSAFMYPFSNGQWLFNSL